MSGTTQAFGGGSRIGPALRVSTQAATIADLAPVVMDVAPVVQDGRCLIEVHAAGVNMSDVKAALGQMPHAVWPRTPGRDYAGVVVQGPAHLMGRQVWGSSGELGIRRDGTHARYVSVAVEEVRDKPSTITLDEAGAVGVPFVTAFEGLQEAGDPAGGGGRRPGVRRGAPGRALCRLRLCRCCDDRRQPPGHRGRGARAHRRPWRGHRL
jgi:NADPH:quinone reductase-like Zn-dependent oxidoreductase